MTKWTYISDMSKTCNQQNIVWIAYKPCLKGHRKKLILSNGQWEIYFLLKESGTPSQVTLV